MSENISPYKQYSTWLFDGNPKSEIPKELLKYNSPITVNYALQMFIMNGKLNAFLNEHFNNIGLYYLEKDELFLFLKKCVKDFRIQRGSIPYIPFKKNEKIFEELRKRCPELKNYDISLLIEVINSSEDKDKIYNALGLEKIEKPKKVKRTKQKKEKEEKTSIKEYLKNNIQETSV